MSNRKEDNNMNDNNVSDEFKDESEENVIEDVNKVDYSNLSVLSSESTIDVFSYSYNDSKVHLFKLDALISELDMARQDGKLEARVRVYDVALLKDIIMEKYINRKLYIEIEKTMKIIETYEEQDIKICLGNARIDGIKFIDKSREKNNGGLTELIMVFSFDLSTTKIVD